jgi:hypothetical protein
MQCYKCFKFGHHESNCVRQTTSICRRCSSNHDKNETCNVPVKCANCGGEHYAISRSCSLWLKEKEILRQKYTQNISFQDARKLVESQGPKQLSYSAAVTKSVKMVDSAVQVNLCQCPPLKLPLPKNIQLHKVNSLPLCRLSHHQSVHQRSKLQTFK